MNCPKTKRCHECRDTHVANLFDHAKRALQLARVYAGEERRGNREVACLTEVRRLRSLIKAARSA